VEALQIADLPLHHGDATAQNALLLISPFPERFTPIGNLQSHPYVQAALSLAACQHHQAFQPSVPATSMSYG
jgi:hypothetical protein